MSNIDFDFIAERFNSIAINQSAANELYYLNFKRNFIHDTRKYSLETVFSFRYKWLYPNELMRIVNHALIKSGQLNEDNQFVDFIELLDQEVYFNFGHESLEIRISIFDFENDLDAKFHKAVLSSLLLARSIYSAVLKNREIIQEKKSLDNSKEVEPEIKNVDEQSIDHEIKKLKPISDSVLASLIFEGIKKIFGF